MKEATDVSGMTSTEKKAYLIEYLTINNCSITKALKDTGVCGATNFYKWKKRDAEFTAKLDKLKDRDVVFLDMAEDGLYDKLKAKDWKAIQYVLDSKGKERGWGKQVEQKIEVVHRAIAEIEVKGLNAGNWGEAVKGSANKISKCEDDTRRLFAELMEQKGEEVTIDVEPDE